MSRGLLVVSSGTGPWECRRFVALLGPTLARELEERGLAIEETLTEGEEAEPRSLSLVLEGRLALARGLEGTHELVARSPRRSRSSRQRWFVGVRLHELAKETATEIDPADVDFRADRSGGPGGQHVNTRSTAVRARHRPSGLSVRVTSERSQHANRRVALRRLAVLLDAERARDEKRDGARRRAEHHLLERGRPVRSWRLDSNGALALLAAVRGGP